MDPISSAMVKFQEFGDFTREFFDGIIRWQRNHHRRRPIEILKRLQREAFSDIMKMRDRQDKVEKLLSFYKTSKGSPFQIASTHVRGCVDMAGAMFMMDDEDDEHIRAVQTSGIQTGLDLRLVFETTLREKDTLVAEFLAGGRDQSNIVERPLSLSKILYAANVSDWFSAVAIPLGARCRDVGVSSTFEGKGVSEYSAFGPSFLNEKNGSALGIMFRKSNVIASLGQFVSGLGSQQTSGITHCFSSFGQVVFQLTHRTKLSLLGLHKGQMLSTQRANLGAMTIPIGMLRQRSYPDRIVAENVPEASLDGSLALMIESELDESIKIGGWIEMKNAENRQLHWSVLMSNIPEDDNGWGVSVGGALNGPRNGNHIQAEAFLDLGFGSRFRLRPAVMYLGDGKSHIPALLLRSSWSL